MRRILAPVAVLGLTVIGFGCGGGAAPVSGNVSLDGKPVEGASVSFTPASEGGGGYYGKTDAQGRYELRGVTNDRTGAPPGKYKVSISLAKGNTSNPDGASKEVVPARYNSRTDLTFDVGPGGTDKADFALTK